MSSGSRVMCVCVFEKGHEDHKKGIFLLLLPLLMLLLVFFLRGSVHSLIVVEHKISLLCSQMNFQARFPRRCAHLAASHSHRKIALPIDVILFLSLTCLLSVLLYSRVPDGNVFLHLLLVPSIHLFTISQSCDKRTRRAKAEGFPLLLYFAPHHFTTTYFTYYFQGTAT
jgi:hypothetical protein